MIKQANKGVYEQKNKVYKEKNFKIKKKSLEEDEESTKFKDNFNLIDFIISPLK